MELDELKNKWKQLDEHVKAQDEKIRELTDSIISGKVKSPLTRLKTHCVISVIVIPFLLPFFFWTYSYMGLNCPGWQKTLLYILTWVFVVFTFVREIYFIYDLRRINVDRETAIESLKRTIKFRKHYHWGVMIDLVIGCVLLLVMMCSFNIEFVSGGIVGCIVGGIIGSKMFRYYVRLINELESAFREWDEQS